MSAMKARAVTTMPTEVVSVELSGEPLEALRTIAALYRLSPDEALKHALARERIIAEELVRGSRLLIQKSDQSLQELVVKESGAS